MVRINHRSPERVEVADKPVPIGALPATIARLVERDRRREIELFIPIDLNKKILKRVMDSCRPAGATVFRVAYKA